MGKNDELNNIMNKIESLFLDSGALFNELMRNSKDENVKDFIGDIYFNIDRIGVKKIKSLINVLENYSNLSCGDKIDNSLEKELSVPVTFTVAYPIFFNNETLEFEYSKESFYAFVEYKLKITSDENNIVTKIEYFKKRF